ncbi:MFS transporter [Balneola sp. EhC07]|uniref:CynX/NimT family MFS transporter n=1 Tax=Balneola sp. EhC07 TaxID=1849360 RepID=UPI0007F46913|nr:MFS transporter [Balneola sp. EhC07]OAN62455.1 MFS transporter [Balneola sp. EhC07]
MTSYSDRPRRDQVLLIAGIILIGFNLRPALSGVGPLIAMIRVSTGLSNSMLGLLTTLPLVAFGILSTLTPLFTRRFGIEKTLSGALLLLTLGIALRAFGYIPLLFLGTILLGIAIAFGNVLLPALVKRDFDKRSGFMTSLYSGMMGVGAALAAGLSVPIAESFPGSWKTSLGVWGVFSFVAFLVWISQNKFSVPTNSKRSFKKAMKDLGSNSLAWNVALFLGLQSIAFYVILAWLPDILISKGFSSSEAGWYLSLSQVTGVLGSVLVPVIAAKKDDQRKYISALILLEAISLIGLWLGTNATVFLWVSGIGFSLGGSFGLALLFIVLRSSDSETATELSGMSQSIGYLLAATGPILIGAVFDLTGDWDTALYILFMILFFKLYTGLKAGKARAI